MERDEDHKQRTPWSLATNWDVSGGTLEGCITLETPDPSSSADEDHQAVALTAPSSPDSGPCEIEACIKCFRLFIRAISSQPHETAIIPGLLIVVRNVASCVEAANCIQQLLCLCLLNAAAQLPMLIFTLAQKHEIRQVYVRSTARVYEIYLLSETHGKEYLCTVQCGAAGKEESTPNDASDEKAMCTQVDRITVEPSVDKVKNDSNGSNEDGWVEVKVSSPSSDGSDGVLSRKNYGESQSSKDFYEATAEISDSNPCIGLTLRLLSLQTKGCVHLEEIYIFAEPVESYDTDHPITAQEKSGESKLLAMLVPTLLQLSKSVVDKRQNLYSSNNKGKGPMPSDDDVEETNLLSHNVTRTKRKELQFSIPLGEGNKLEEANGESTKSTRSDYDGTNPGNLRGLEFVSKENDRSCNRAESLLDQLFHRLGRIETFCEGIEKNMLKSFSSIDTRLQRLEQQMELMTARSHSPELFYPSIKITAPEFSGNDSETNSRYNDDQNYITSEVSKKDIYDKDEPRREESMSNSVRNDVESMSNSVRNDVNEQRCHVPESCREDVAFYVSPQLLPQLVVTAPDFSVVDNYSDGESVDEVVDASSVNDNDTLEMSSKGRSRDKSVMSLDEAVACALAGFFSLSSVQTPQSGENNTKEDVKEIESRPCETIQVPSNCSSAAAAINMVRAGPIWEEEFEDQCLNCSMDPSTNQCMHDNKQDGLERKDFEIDTFNQSDVKAVGDNISFKISDQSVTLKESITNLTSATTKTLLGSPKDFQESDDGSSKDANDCGDGEAQRAECCDEFEKLPKLAFDGAVDFKFPILDVKFYRDNSNTEFHLSELLGSGSGATTEDLFKEEVDVTIDSELDKIRSEESKFPVLDEPFAKELVIKLRTSRDA
ncbi:hypothetical protein Sjap_013123 [Stephania japonica]|uniref:Uncharacterized protein n=1 Tax=Stephania japonica TaxID=461633 RepID=A0AAP0P112_9MAGN